MNHQTVMLGMTYLFVVRTPNAKRLTQDMEMSHVGCAEVGLNELPTLWSAIDLQDIQGQRSLYECQMPRLF